MSGFAMSFWPRISREKRLFSRCFFGAAASDDNGCDDDVDDAASFGLPVAATAAVAVVALWLALECEFSCEPESW